MAEVQRPIVPDRLYRYRSLTRDPAAVRQEIESILQKYLYCADFARMNDPMEGFYRPSDELRGERDYKAILREIALSKSRSGIACFTETYEDVLMWTHYAGNYTGMCLAYCTEDLINGLPNHVNLVRLAYVDKPPLIDHDEVRNAEAAATRILSQKKYNWSYEREWRVLGPLGKVRFGRIQAVKEIYFGSRVNLEHRHKILTRIQGTEIEAFMMQVQGYDHTWQPVNAAARESFEASLR